MALLGEMHAMNGHMTHYGSQVYAAQDPWVFSASIKENILFGKEMDDARYNDVLRSCCLDEVLTTLRVV